MTNQARVVALHTQQARGELPRPTSNARLIPGGGLHDDLHGRRSERALLIASTRDLDQFGLAPGALREQITLDLPGLMQLPAGARLQIGPPEAGVEIEILEDCAPCTHIGELHGVTDPVAYEARLQGHRGKIARFVAPEGAGVTAVEGHGEIRVGDPISLREPEHA